MSARRTGILEGALGPLQHREKTPPQARYPRILSAFCLLLLSASTAWGLDPERRLSQYGHTAWRLQDGYFTGLPLAIAQTTDGYLWLGTEDGLWRFDGARFMRWKVPGGQALDSGIGALLGARDGGLWVGT